MYSPDLVDVAVDVFGGYCPAIPPSDQPSGAAGIAQDVVFPQGAVRTRGGLKNYFSVASPISALAAINGLKSYVTPTLLQRMLAWDSLGKFYKENPQGTLSLVSSRPYAGLFYQSNSLFGREYQAFFNSLGGFDIPRQFDDTNWDRVSQSGPGTSPVVTDEVGVSFTITPAAAGLVPVSGVVQPAATGLTQVGTLVTVKFTALVDATFKVGDTITIAGAGVAGYNGTFTIASFGTVAGVTVVTYINPITGLAASGGGTGTFNLVVVTTTAAMNFTNGQQVTIAGAGVAGYNGTWKVRFILAGGSVTCQIVINSTALAASGGGTISPSGNVAIGLHGVSVAFITRQGFITQASTPNFWTAAGSVRAICSQIPIGPANVVGRILLFTPVITAPAVTGSFYSLPNGSSQLTPSAVMVINDNVTTSLTVDFTDAILSAGFSANYLFTQVELGEPSFMIGYNSRLVWLGERNRLANLVNMGFDGGFGTDLLVRKYPLGWTQDAATYAGGGAAIAGGFTADWGDAYAITGNGSAICGKITQSAYADYLGVPIIRNNTAYSVRVRVAKAGALVAGSLQINLTSALGGFTTAGLSVTAAQLSASYAEFTGVLTAALSAPNVDLLLQVYVDGTPTNGASFLIDSIEIYPTNSPFNYSVAKLSHAFNPESYDATTGQIQIRPNDGQQLRAAFPIRNNLYLAKDHYLCYVADDGTNEPSSWTVNEVSATIGICGSNACDWTEEWAVFAERSGLYICWGSDPVKITPEIQRDASGLGRVSWESINWQYGHTIWVRIDKANKMILVGAPVNGATSPNIVFVLDYRWLDTASDIANSPMVTYSSFTGKIQAHGRGRRWATWLITANSMTFAERSDGTVQPFFGNGAGNGKIYQQLDCATQASDDGVAVDSQYQTYGLPSGVEEQVYQLGAHRKLLGYLKFRAVGAGNLMLAIGTAARSTLLRNYSLSTSPAGDGERPLNLHGERFYITAHTLAVGAWFQLEKLTACVRKEANIVVRGMSS